ncbi:hypothetical protein [Couchioplanes caeruleus]|uniref:Uncharacterized protein n=2 Tax=Couchioplanes caeruleus TaxID=56438 RepID=A0A1K0GPU1_9ACTN|nr:hypothetical protein [Couchioplanes caeruleus]OJF14414.1 hypothetical protein BG844_09950 [Couchioplanes caeruleus subsp. caeruleus]ROP32032.1 hypothetical protein EDD30_4960 [Couchioplanes caeruleus]
MRWTWLYLRSRGVPASAGTGVGLVVTVCALWSAFARPRDVDFPLVLLVVVLLVSAVCATLAGPDDALDRTAAKPWKPLRLVHLLSAYAVMMAPLLLTRVTAGRFGPVAEVARDAGGLLGLTALGAVLIGAHRAWLPPLLWTLPALYFSASGGSSERAATRALTWMVQPIGDRPAAIMAAALAVAGLVAYALRGTPLRPASDPAPA